MRTVSGRLAPTIWKLTIRNIKEIHDVRQAILNESLHNTDDISAKRRQVGNNLPAAVFSLISKFYFSYTNVVKAKKCSGSKSYAQKEKRMFVIRIIYSACDALF